MKPTTSNLLRIQTDTIKDTFYWRNTEQNRFVYAGSKRMFLNGHYGPRSSSQWEHKIRFGLPTRLHRHKIHKLIAISKLKDKWKKTWFLKWVIFWCLQVPQKSWENWLQQDLFSDKTKITIYWFDARAQNLIYFP